ncbi:putative bifunctional diguanylate cyclase/phosphodiesterase [Sphingomonas qomolangmaensis]|uniref:EAL domain-containing protein n=1 Tax=Sphingomonas qomolangmaensis TaxID=2918765 RepID=A0ABY5L907_9SPHN|nr:EAL domain-containing protein [Sphingomonas qomolangmaensis]UUL83262.1 EAL domain-containing protein [Sphingomonas qomolangmaensis]
MRFSIAARVTVAAAAMLAFLLLLLGLSIDVGRQVQAADRQISALTGLLKDQEDTDRAQRALRLAIGEATRSAEDGDAVSAERWGALRAQLQRFRAKSVRSRALLDSAEIGLVREHIEVDLASARDFVSVAAKLLMVAEDRPDAVTTVMPDFLRTLRALEARRTATRDVLVREIDVAVQKSIVSSRRSTLRLVVGAIVALLILIVLVLWIRRSVIKPMVEIAKGLRHPGFDRIATACPPFVDRSDEVGDLARGLLEYRLNVGEQEKARRQIDFLAHHDALTGLPNRLVFESRLRQELRRTGRTADSVAVFAIDLDDFKAINDRLGHAGGDEALRRAGKMLVECARADDLVARIGGDEFAVIQVAADQPAAAQALLARLFKATENQTDNLSVRMSIGVAIARGEQDVEELYNHADVALYRAKADGRNTARFFDEGMEAETRLRRRLSRDLQGAAQAGQFHICYQPIAACDTLEVIGYEALLRWRHPDLGDVAPSVFIPIAESTGSIDNIGRWMAGEALAEAARWRPDLTLALNLSPVQFRQPDLADALYALAGQHGVAIGRVQFEVTENVTLLGHQRDAVLTSLRQLQHWGAKVVMDDFGTGHASLSNLQAFEFDGMKIDGRFIAAMLDHRSSALIVRAAIGLGKSLGVPVVAECVETQAQFEQLCAWGCTQVQGYLFGRPVSADQLTAARG